MKRRFLLTWVMVLSLLTLAFPQAQSSANAMTLTASHIGIRGMKAVSSDKASW